MTVVLLVILYALSSLFTYFVSRRVVLHPVDAKLARAASQFMRTESLPLRSNSHFDATYWIVLHADATTATNAPQTISGTKAITKTLASEQKSVHQYSLKANGETYRTLVIPGDVAGMPTIKSVMFLTNESVQIYDLGKLKSVIVIVGIFGIILATALGFFLSERMLRPIRKSWKRQLAFVADASHELRTPLAVIQSNLGIAMDHTDQTIVDNLEWLNNAHGQTRRLSKLVESLLFLARSDAGHVSVNPQKIDLRDVIACIEELYQSVAQMRGIQLDVTMDGAATIMGDSEKLHQALVILMDNAVKFTSEGGRIRLDAAHKKNKIIIKIYDTGRGMDSETLKHVFDRFYTSDPSRTRNASNSGTGLGLPTAEQLISAHGGSIRMESDGPGCGATAIVELPLLRTG